MVLRDCVVCETGEYASHYCQMKALCRTVMRTKVLFCE